MGRIIASILISFVLVSACSEKMEKDPEYIMTMKEFHELKNKPEKIVYRFNKMTKENRWKFIKNFLPGCVLYGPPNTFFKFLKTGKIVIDRDDTNQKDKLVFGNWKIQDDQLRIDINQIDSLGFKKMTSKVKLEVSYLNKGENNEKSILVVVFFVKTLEPNFLKNLKEKKLIKQDNNHIKYIYENHTFPPFLSPIREYCLSHDC